MIQIIKVNESGRKATVQLTERARVDFILTAVFQPGFQSSSASCDVGETTFSASLRSKTKAFKQRSK